MTNRTNAPTLLPPTPLVPATQPITAPPQVRSGMQLSHQERAVIAKGNLERTVIHETERTTQEGLRGIARIHVAGVACFEEGTRYVYQIRDALKHNEEHAAVVAAFVQNDIPVFSNHLMGAMSAGSFGVASAVAEDHHQGVEGPGFWRRLVGG